MAQGKIKIKTKLPSCQRTKQGKAKKGIQRRNNAPIQPKKAKIIETNQLKKLMSKKLNEAMEDELREQALEGKQSLTKKRDPNESNVKKSDKKK